MDPCVSNYGGGRVAMRDSLSSPRSLSLPFLPLLTELASGPVQGVGFFLPSTLRGVCLFPAHTDAR